jgi:hypothetical protein
MTYIHGKKTSQDFAYIVVFLWIWATQGLKDIMQFEIYTRLNGIISTLLISLAAVLIHSSYKYSETYRLLITYWKITLSSLAIWLLTCRYYEYSMSSKLLKKEWPLYYEIEVYLCNQRLRTKTRIVL